MLGGSGSGGTGGAGVVSGNAGDAAADTTALIAAVEAEGLVHIMDTTALEAARGKWVKLVNPVE